MLKSLKSKMIIPIVSLLILMVAFIFVYVSLSAANLAGSLTEERVLLASSAAGAQLGNLEDQTRLIALSVADSHAIVSNMQDWNTNPLGRIHSRRAMVDYLNSIIAGMGVNSFIVRDSRGVVVLRLHAPDYFGDREIDLAATAALRGEVSTSYSSMMGIPMGMSTTAPIWYDGEIIGTMTPLFFMHTEEFVDRFAGIFNAEVTVFHGSTRVATTIVTDEGDRAVGIDAGAGITAEVLRGGNSLMTEVELFGVPFHAYYMPLAGFDGNPVGMFSVAFSNEYTIAATSAMQRNLVIIGAVSLAVVIFVMLLFIIRMLKPISRLTNTLDDTANGDLTKKLPEQGRDEIAQASRSFNKTMEELRKMITAIKSQAGDLSAIGNDLASNMTETASAMNEITANIQSIKGRVMNQSASVSETNATMEQVTVNINKLNGQIDLQSSAVSLSSTAIEQMLANIQSVTSTLGKNAQSLTELQESAEDGKSSLHEVAANIQEVARESEGLLEINAVMENIAGQTNLLSMNAAIEAARAGESGKGFAVVAGEIRKLAESSASQSNTIAAVLKKIKNSIDKIISSTDKVLDRFDAIDQKVKTVSEQGETIRSAMEEQNQGSKQILEASGQVHDITRQVKGGSVEMLEGSKEVIHESKNLEKATHEITDGMNEMAVGAQQVNQAVNNVNDLSSKTQENIAVLVQAVSRFKV